MKAMKLLFSILAMVFFCGVSQAQAPKDDNEGKENHQIIIIKKTVDEDGNETIEKIVKKGDEAENYNWKDAAEKDFDLEKMGDLNIIQLDENGALPEDLNEQLKNLSIEVEALNGENHIKIMGLSDDGEDLDIEWDGSGEIPDDIKKELEEKGIHLKQLNGSNDNSSVFQVKVSENNAFLGVVLGKKVTVENSNGVETANVEGESELGVVVNQVVEGSAAEAAGLQAKDIITALDGKPVKTANELTQAIGEKEPGDRVSIAYLRDGEAAQTEATLTVHRGEHNSFNYQFDDVGGKKYEIDEDGYPHVFFFRNEEDDKDGVIKKRRIIIIKKGGSEDEVETEVTNSIDESNARGKESRTLKLKSFNAFPNPTNGALRVQFTAEAVPTQIKIMDVSGKVVYKEELNGFDGQYDNQIEMKDAPKGTLLLSIRQGEKTHTQKIVYE